MTMRAPGLRTSPVSQAARCEEVQSRERQIPPVARSPGELACGCCWPLRIPPFAGFSPLNTVRRVNSQMSIAYDGQLMGFASFQSTGRDAV